MDQSSKSWFNYSTVRFSIIPHATLSAETLVSALCLWLL